MTRGISAIAAAASRMLGDTVAVETRRPDGGTDDLVGTERDAAKKMVARRVAEFSAGRAASRRAMVRLGAPAAAVPMAPDRAPVWPGGLVGSISHSDTACIAAVAHTVDVSALGVDIEPDKPLSADLVGAICSDAELAPFDADRHRRIATAIFAAKECTYKCQYPLTRQLFGFDRLHITLDRSLIKFTATFRADTGVFPAGHMLEGQIGVAGDHVVATMALPSAPG